MKYKGLYILIVALVLPLTIYTAPKQPGVKTYLNRWESMSLRNAKKRWGEKTFDAISFKKGNIKERSSMVVDLIKSKYFIGKDSNLVREELGSYSGFFWSDTIPTYIVEERSITNSKTWQIVFLIDENWKVTEVRIQNNAPRI